MKKKIHAPLCTPAAFREGVKTLFILFSWAVVITATQTLSAATIAVQDFETSPATPTATYTAVNGGVISGTTASTDRPASVSYNTSAGGSQGYQVNNGTATLTFGAINTSAYTSNQLTLRVQSISVNSTANGAETTDYVEVQISPDNGTTYYPTVRVTGNSNNNSWWAYSATGNASTAYDGDATVVAVAASSGGQNAAGPSTITITSLPAVSQLRVKIVMVNNAAGERWSVDDLLVTGTLATVAPTVASSAATSIATNTATLNGNVTADGGATVTDRGFVYKTSSGVTISDNKTQSGTGTGAFMLSPSLSLNTQYYFKAYAINSIGTSLSSELNFWTLAGSPAAPTVNNATASTLDVAITSGDGNPGGTVYAIQETTSGNYVQANGSLAGSAVYQTAATWGTKTVTGLSSSTLYTFKAKAQNGAGTDTAFGSTANGTTTSAGCTPPTINTQPSDQTACSGSSVSFTVSASGTSLTYQWRKNGSNLSNAGHYSGVTTATLTVNPADSSDAATAANGYDCVITENNNGPCTSTTSPKCALTINTAPAITASSGDQTTCANTPATFTVTATGTGLTYQWNLNGAPLSNGGIYAGVTTATLTVTPTSTGDSVVAANGYDCTVSGTCTPPQTSTRRALTVNATVTPSVSISANTGTNICAGTTVIFTATPVNGGATPAYQWKSNNVNVGTSSAAYTNATLVNGTVISVVVTPSADVCVAGATATDAVAMNVTASVVPSVSISSSITLPTCAGNQIIFTATPANGGVAPSYQWKTNGVNTGPNSAFYTNSFGTNTTVSVVLTPSSEICVAPTTATNSIAATINQFALPGGSATIFSENMGAPSGTTALASYTGWQNSAPITFTSTAANAPDVRNTTASSGYTGASGGGNVFFTSTTGARNLVISGINSAAYSSISLSFGLKAETAVVPGDPLVVEVSTDGTSYTALTYTGPATTTGYALYTPSGTIPSTSNLRIRFSKSTTGSYRLDDIKLTGVPLTPTNATITASGPTTFNYGSSVTLSANAGGAAYSWSNGSNTQSIVVSNAGTYAVTIVDAQGCSSSASTNVVVIDPVVTAQPTSVTNAPGAAAAFTVTAVGTPALAYQWQHAGTNLINGGTISGAQSSTLNISSVSFADAGSYSVLVANGNGASTNSALATLTVLDPAITSQPVNSTNDYGTTATFNVTGASGSSLSYVWRYNGNPLSEGGQYSGTASSSLSVATVAKANEGNYTVVLTSTSGSITSAVATLTVHDPIIVSQPTSQTNIAGSTANFTVTAEGTPTVTYQWRRGSGNISGETSATLSLPAVTQADANNYSVIVSGAGLSVTSAVVTLTVIDPPAVTTSPISRTNSVGDRASFNVSSTGVSRSLQWRLDGVDITDATNSTYTVDDVTSSSAGSYDVVITNIAGSVTSAPAVLTVVGGGATKLAQWNFNSTTPDANTGSGSSSPSAGSGTASTTGGTTVTFAGGSNSDPASTGSDNSRWSVATFPAAGAANKTGGARFSVSTVGHSRVVLSWEQQASNTGSKYSRLQYTTNGTDFVDSPLVMAMTAGGTFYYFTIDMTSVPGVANNPNFAFQMVSEFESTATGSGSAAYVAANSGSTYGTSGTEGLDLVTVFGSPLTNSTTSLTTSPNPATPGTEVSFFATVSGEVDAPTGTILFKTNGVALGAGISLAADGKATNSTSTLSHGTNTVTAEYSGDVNYLPSTNSVLQIVNALPVVSNLALGVPAGGSASLVILGGKNPPTDTDGDALVISAVTQGAHGTVTFTSTSVTYTSTSATSSDSFTYTVSDGVGGTATATVNVTVSSGGGSFNQIAATTIEGGALRFTYLGIPGTNYALEVTHSLSGEVVWSPLKTNAASGTGSIIFTNTPSQAPTNDFYRTRYIP